MRSRCTYSPSIFSALYLREQDTGQGLHLVILFCRAHCGQFHFRCGNGSVWAALFENHLPGLPHHRRQFYVHHGFSSHRQKVQPLFQSLLRKGSLDIVFMLLLNKSMGVSGIA